MTSHGSDFFAPQSGGSYRLIFTQKEERVIKKRMLRSVAFGLIAMLLVGILPQVALAAGSSMDDAQSISLGQTYNGTITESNGADYYKFDLASSGNVVLSASAKMERVSYALYDADGNRLWNDSYHWDSTSQMISTTKSFDLTSGTYYYYVGKGYYGETGDYSFSISFSSANESFSEPENGNNNTVETANSITLGSKYNGQIAINDAVDFYVFSLPESGNISLAATAKMERVSYALYDDSGNRLWSDGYSWDSKSQMSSANKSFDLVTGTYYFYVGKGYYGETGNYTFSLTFLSANESFPETGTGINNTMETASQISLNKKYFGQIAINDTKDFYKFTCTSSGEIKITALAKMERVTYAIYDTDGKSVWNKNASWNSTSKTISTDESVNLSSGTYYFYVGQGYYGEKGTYEFTLSNTASAPEDPSDDEDNNGDNNGGNDNGDNNGDNGGNDSGNTGGGSSSFTFIDVSVSAWYYNPVVWAVEHNITSGTSTYTFSPNVSCTRAQAVMMLWKAAGMPTPSSRYNPFYDVRSGAYYYQAVLWAVEKGITAGTSSTTFSPDQIVTRAQTMVFLHKMLGYPSGGYNSFYDVPGNSYYANAVAWAASTGVTAGTAPGYFSPNKTCTRAEIVTFIYKVYR